jgi:hypothetical protein
MTYTETKPWESRLRDAASQMETAAARVEQDVRRVLTYINDEVMPDVRRNGSHALKAAAQELEWLAHKMEAANRSGAEPPPKSPRA